MFSRKKHIPAHNFNPLAKKNQSHKKRNTLIGLASSAAAVVIAGAAAKKQDKS